MSGLSAADRVELADLVARYAAGVDARAYDTVGELFTEDAVLVLPAPPDEFAPVTRHVGRERLALALRGVDGFPLTRHAVVGQVFDAAAPDAATGRIACEAHHLSRRDSGELSDLVWHADYADTYRRTAGTWRFTRREVRLRWIETRTPRRWSAGP